ncbi:MAG TPA: AsmA family protein [Terriglobales bacterium]|nr:AsmA family protein [Terriglobales bacterium]
MALSRTRKLVVVAIAAITLAALVPPLINVNRFRNGLATLISRSIGRPVTMGAVSIRLVPQPRFVISDLVISDDPLFSAEPILRAESVTASLRLTSLWRGRAEISRLDLEYPSLNLVRTPDGRWNVESLVMHASHVPAAPTAKPQAESRPRFPYISAVNGRINLKLGQEKQPHVLMDSDFALWLESENEWNMRLEARPTRTDANLRDTGTVRLQGSFRRAESLGDTPVRLRFDLEKGQLGQWTALIFGHDRGWRGNVDAGIEIQGTLASMDFTSRTDISDFRRYDIASGDSFDTRIDCKGKSLFAVSVATQTLSSPGRVVAVDCLMPLENGKLSLAGDFSLKRTPDFKLKLFIKDVPMTAAASIFRRVKRNVASDLTAAGVINAEFDFVRLPNQDLRSQPRAAGTGKVAGLVLSSKSLETQLEFPEVTFGFEGVTPPATRVRTAADPAIRATLIVDQIQLPLGGPLPVSLSLRADPSQILLAAKGGADLSRFMSAASLVGLLDPRYKISGAGTFDLSVLGAYQDFADPVITGIADLSRIRTQVDGVSAPLEIASAKLVMTPQAIVLLRLNARLEGSRTQVEGSITMPRICGVETCLNTFDLHAQELDLDELNRTLNPRFRSSDWLSLPLQVFRGETVQRSRVMSLQAQGNITIGRLVMRKLVANRFSSRLSFDRGKLVLDRLSADILGGRHEGHWAADLTGKSPSYTGSGRIDRLYLAQVNLLLGENLSAGMADVHYGLRFNGTTAADLRQSANGNIEFSWKKGVWRNPTFAVPILQFSEWTGRLTIAGEKVSLLNGKMRTPSGTYQTSGTGDFSKNLRLTLAGDRDQLALTGPLQALEVESKTAEAVSPRDSASKLKNANPAKTR